MLGTISPEGEFTPFAPPPSAKVAASTTPLALDRSSDTEPVENDVIDPVTYFEEPTFRNVAALLSNYRIPVRAPL